MQKVYLNGCQYRGDVVHGAPLILQNVQADISIAVDIGVKDAREELDDGRLARVLLCESNDQVEDAALQQGLIGSGSADATKNPRTANPIAVHQQPTASAAFPCRKSNRRH
eukprot:GHVT01101312.1.p1 GENE.GHVT01101312.1~~GHVT01101312.1.p1  ORF type:complete len:111 (-),score=13.36 GHVT01101312.1:563-895(-)